MSLMWLDDEQELAHYTADLDYFALMCGVDVEECDASRIKMYYDLGLWSKSQVYDVACWWIKPEDYMCITGEPYSD